MMMPEPPTTVFSCVPERPKRFFFAGAALVLVFFWVVMVVVLRRRGATDMGARVSTLVTATLNNLQRYCKKFLHLPVSMSRELQQHQVKLRIGRF